MAQPTGSGTELKIAVYLRISVDDGTSTAPDRQLEDCQRYAAMKGWDVVRVFEDRDLSAWSGVERPGFEAMLAAARSREVDGVLFWKLDRLVRRIAEFGRVWQLCDRVGTFLASTQEALDTSTPIGVAVAHLLVAVAEMESNNTSLRLRRKEEERANLGKPKVTSVRPYGYSLDWSEVIEAEADIIRECAARLLAGEPLKTVVRDLNDRGVPTATGNGTRWQAIILKTLMISPRLWGERTHLGDVVAVGRWEAILSKEDGEQLRQLFAGRSTGPRGAPYKTLLAGLLRCGVCNDKMTRGRAHGAYRYLCPRGHNTAMAHDLEGAIVSHVLDVLDTPVMAAKMASRGESKAGDLVRERIRLFDKLDQYAKDYAEDVMSRAEWLAARRPTQERLEAVERALAAEDRSDPLLGLQGGIRAGWDTLDVAKQRAVLSSVLVSVRVERGTKGERFDPAVRLPVDGWTWVS